MWYFPDVQVKNRLDILLCQHLHNACLYTFQLIIKYQQINYCPSPEKLIMIINATLFKENVTIFGKIDHLRASNEIQFLPVHEKYIHALSRNTNCLTIDGQVCFYRRLFTNAVKPRGCISWFWSTLIGLHGVPNYSSWQSWPPLWIASVQVTYWRHSTAL